MSVKLKNKQISTNRVICAGRGRGLLFLRSGRSEFTHPASFLQHFQNEASVPQRRRSRRRWWGGGGRRRRSSGSFGGLEREGEFGAGLALPQDDFLLLLLLPLTVLLQLHALLVDLSLLLHDTQLILGLQHDGERTSDTQRAETARRRGGEKFFKKSLWSQV